jgi:hypothetical protein
MRKITLSAAILAMTMMGCSDVGLDNSVASAPASEVKSEQSGKYLAKSIYYNQSEVFDRLEKMEPTNPYNNGYQFYAYPSAGIGLWGQTHADLDLGGYEAIGEYHVVQAPFAPNTMLVVTGLYSDCERGYNAPYYTTANCRGWRNLEGVEYKVNQGIMDLTAHSLPNARGQKLSQWKNYDELGAVSAFVAVWNQGSPYELVTSGVTYNGGMFEGADGAKKARAIYRTYIWPKVRNKLFFD